MGGFGVWGCLRSMPGNIRKKTGGGVTEKDYLKARRRVIRSSQICYRCGEAIDLSLKPICRFVDTSGFDVYSARDIPLTCGPNCVDHGRKANPWSASADHVIAVADLPPGSPLLADSRNMKPTHLKCNIKRQTGAKDDAPQRVTSKDWYA